MSKDVQGGRDSGTPAAVAYDLMRDILFDDPGRPHPDSPAFRAYVLDLYAECLLAVRGKRGGGGPDGAVGAGRKRERSAG